MILSSWNVNSVRARIDNIKEYLKKFSPDLLMMQEIKTQNETYPYDEIKALNYDSFVFGQKSYNGVAIASKKKLKNIQNDIFKDKNKQSRLISAQINHNKKNIIIINIYTPNGNPVDTEKYSYKIYWLENLIKKLKSLLKENENIIIGGDFNIIEPGCALIGWEGREGRSEEKAALQLKNWFEAEGWEIFTVDLDPFFVHIDLMVVMLSEKLAAACLDTIDPSVGINALFLLS